MSDTLEVKRREQTGSKRIRRLRQKGVVPAVVYGHGQATQSVVLQGEQISATIRQGHRLVDLTGDVKDKAFIREVQWDTYGVEILHVDLFRVSETDKIKTTVALEFKGEAPGIKEGGIVEVVLHEVEIECPVAVLPDKLLVNISGLKLKDAIAVSQVELPKGARMLSSPSAIVVHCVSPKVEEELTPAVAAPGAVEPEVIGEKERKEREAAAAAAEAEKKK